MYANIFIFLNNLFTFIFKAGYRALNVYFNIIYSIIKVCFMLTIVCTVNTRALIHLFERCGV